MKKISLVLLPLFLATLLCAPSSFAQLGNSTKSVATAKTAQKSGSQWPEKATPPNPSELTELQVKNKKSKRASREGEFRYETENYTFISPVELDTKGKKELADFFEGTYAIVKSTPLTFPRVDKRRKYKFNVFFFRTINDYYQAGGPPDSIGAWLAKIPNVDITPASKNSENNDVIFAPFPSLNSTSSGKLVHRVVRGGDAHTISHELTHQLTHQALDESPWANEGFSEYVAFAQNRNDPYNFSNMPETLKGAVREYGTSLKIPFTLEEFFGMSYEKFAVEYGRVSGTVHTNYMLAALLVTYFFQLDGENGIKSFTAYMKDIRRGGNTKKAIKQLTGKHKSMKNLRESFVKAWAKEGVKIEFTKAEQ